MPNWMHGNSKNISGSFVFDVIVRAEEDYEKIAGFLEQLAPARPEYTTYSDVLRQFHHLREWQQLQKSVTRQIQDAKLSITKMK
jgi:hypothetical protein